MDLPALISAEGDDLIVRETPVPLTDPSEFVRVNFVFEAHSSCTFDCSFLLGATLPDLVLLEVVIYFLLLMPPKLADLDLECKVPRVVEWRCCFLFLFVYKAVLLGRSWFIGLIHGVVLVLFVLLLVLSFSAPCFFDSALSIPNHKKLEGPFCTFAVFGGVEFDMSMDAQPESSPELVVSVLCGSNPVTETRGDSSCEQDLWLTLD